MGTRTGPPCLLSWVGPTACPVHSAGSLAGPLTHRSQHALSPALDSVLPVLALRTSPAPPRVTAARPLPTALRQHRSRFQAKPQAKVASVTSDWLAPRQVPPWSTQRRPWNRGPHQADLPKGLGPRILSPSHVLLGKAPLRCNLSE